VIIRKLIVYQLFDDASSSSPSLTHPPHFLFVKFSSAELLSHTLLSTASLPGNFCYVTPDGDGLRIRTAPVNGRVVGQIHASPAHGHTHTDQWMFNGEVDRTGQWAYGECLYGQCNGKSGWVYIGYHSYWDC